jgi:hypothetical protein
MFLSKATYPGVRRRGREYIFVVVKTLFLYFVLVSFSETYILFTTTSVVCRKEDLKLGIDVLSLI